MLKEFEVSTHGWGVCAKRKGRDQFVTAQKLAPGYMGTSPKQKLARVELVSNGRCLKTSICEAGREPEEMLRLMRSLI